MNPTGNLQGSYCVVSLATGKSINRRKSTELPITDDVIARVQALAQAEKTYFEWAPNMPVDDLPAEHQEPPPLPDLRGANNLDKNNDDNEEEVEAEENAEENADKEGEEGEEGEDTIYEDEGALGAPDEDEGAPGAPRKDEGEQGAPDGAQEAPTQNEDQVQNEEQEAQEASLMVDEAPSAPAPPGHHHNLRGKELNYDKRLIVTCLTQLAGIIPKGPQTRYGRRSTKSHHGRGYGIQPNWCKGRRIWRRGHTCHHRRM